MDSSSFINVHVYDGRLKDIFQPSRYYTVEEKVILFGMLYSRLQNPVSRNMLEIMTTDLQKMGNYQAENDLDASDVLADLINMGLTSHLTSAISEQLSDSRQLGTCPSGRATRLLQLWRAFKGN
jgi:hypothetical protein